MLARDPARALDFFPRVAPAVYTTQHVEACVSSQLCAAISSVPASAILPRCLRSVERRGTVHARRVRPRGMSISYLYCTERVTARTHRGHFRSEEIVPHESADDEACTTRAILFRDIGRHVTVGVPRPASDIVHIPFVADDAYSLGVPLLKYWGVRAVLEHQSYRNDVPRRYFTHTLSIVNAKHVCR